MRSIITNQDLSSSIATAVFNRDLPLPPQLLLDVFKKDYVFRERKIK